MGIKNLNNMVRKFAPCAINIQPLNYYKDKKIAIDTSILIYKSIYHYNQYTDYPHLVGILNKCIIFIKNGIIPIFIFDGTPPLDKRNTLNKRYSNKVNIKNKINIIENKIENNIGDKIQLLKEITKLQKQYIIVTKTHHDQIKEMLSYVGIPYLTAEGEAEATCALLTKQNKVDYTFTDDTDSLTFGSTKVLKFSNKKNYLVDTNLSKILDNFNMTMDQFIDFCILCGCDYSPTIKNIGPLTAFKLIKQFNCIENILEYINQYSKYIVPDNFNYINSRNLFKVNYNIEIDINLQPFQKENFNIFLKKYNIKKIEYYNNIFEKYLI